MFINVYEEGSAMHDEQISIKIHRIVLFMSLNAKKFRGYETN